MLHGGMEEIGLFANSNSNFGGKIIELTSPESVVDVTAKVKFPRRRMQVEKLEETVHCGCGCGVFVGGSSGGEGEGAGDVEDPVGIDMDVDVVGVIIVVGEAEVSS